MEIKNTPFKIYPADVTGPYRLKRDGVSVILIILFLILPWIKINGHPALLLDFLNGKFSVFGLAFWSHDAPMLLFVFLGAAVSLAFVTSVWGRVWCGWACPQTVFVGSVFRRIERWIEGDGWTQRKLDSAPWTEEKITKKFLKWAAFVAVSILLSHSFLAYFIGAETLAQMMKSPPSEHLGSFFAMAFISGAVLFDFGWFREQFCIMICPYGRFQSVLMDDQSRSVIYDSARGEPRRGTTAEGSPSGDCVSCNRCVQVCPTGIDIRNGLQLECIACTACIDACDTVMTKIKKPKGLIRYSNNGSFAQVFRIRPLLYLSVLGLMAAGITWIVLHRKSVQTILIRAVGAPYQEVLRQDRETEIVNRFNLDLQNQTFESARISLTDSPEWVSQGIFLVSPALPIELPAGSSKRIELFVRFPKSLLKNGSKNLSLNALKTETQQHPTISIDLEVPLVGPL